MKTYFWSKRAVILASLLTAFSVGTISAAETEPSTEGSRIARLEARIAELEAKQEENWLTAERASQIKAIVQEVLADSKSRGQSGDGAEVGYKNGFYIQTADKNYKLIVNGYIQFRYEFAQSNFKNPNSSPTRTVTAGQTTKPTDPSNSNGFDIRRARIIFSGNVLSPDITYKLGGDFYGASYLTSTTSASSGGFAVTDAWMAYRFSDVLRLKAGAFMVPFSKSELTGDPNLTLMERPEELAPFDPIRALGISLYGDLIADKFSYEINANDGSKTNSLRADDAYGVSPNLDNRMAFYGRLQYAGAGKLADFATESDLRKNNREFIWMLGGAVGYESQNATNNATPSPQNTAGVSGLSSNNSNGFISPYVLNGDLFRGTIDWSAKYKGWSLNIASYFQQINANPGNTSTTSASAITTGPYGASKSSFFQHGGYGQVGYFVIPQRLEVDGRVGYLATEGGPNTAEWYSLGLNYYLYGNNAKIQSDITYSPEAPYTDASGSLLQNSSNVAFRIQLQLAF